MIRATAKVKKIIDTGEKTEAILCGTSTISNATDNTYVDLQIYGKTGTMPVLCDRLSVVITVDHKDAKTFLRPGKKYYVDFTEIPDDKSLA